MNNIQNHSDKGIIKYLIGNKIDTEKREVPSSDAENVAKEYGMNYFETSARLNKNITEVITSLVKEIYTKTGYDTGAAGFGLSAGPTKTSSNCC